MAFDSLFGNVVLLTPFDYEGSSTVVSDVKGHSLTVTGAAAISQSSPQFGTGRLHLDGTGGTVYAAHSADNDMTGAVDFCIECWVNLKTGSVGGRIVGCGTTGVGVNWGVEITADLKPRLYWGDTSNSYHWLTWNTVSALNTWIFFKWSITGTVVQCWKNGSSIGTSSVNNTTQPRVARSGDYILIGKAHDGTLPFKGYLDDLRVTIGSSRPGDTATPTAAFPTVGMPAIIGSVPLTLVPGSTMAVGRGHAIIGDVPLTLVPESVMDPTLNYQLVGSVPLSLIPSATMVKGVMGTYVLSGNVPLSLVPGAVFALARARAIIGDIALLLTPSSAMGVSHVYSFPGQCSLQLIPQSVMSRTLSKGFTGHIRQVLLPVANMVRRIDIPANWISRQYHCVLTGSPDLTLPVSSISANLTASGGSYMSLVIHAAAGLVDDVIARNTGEVIVSRLYLYSDGSQFLQEFIRANYDALTSYNGPMAGITLTLSARKTIAVTKSKAVQLSGAMYSSQSNGQRRYRCTVDDLLALGDQATINGEIFVVGSIAYNINANSEFMEISEYIANGVDLPASIGSNARPVPLRARDYAFGQAFYDNYYLSAQEFTGQPVAYLPDGPYPGDYNYTAPYVVYSDSSGLLWAHAGYDGYQGNDEIIDSVTGVQGFVNV